MKEARGNHRLMGERIGDGIIRGAKDGAVGDEERLEPSRSVKAVAPSRVRYLPATHASVLYSLLAQHRKPY